MFLNLLFGNVKLSFSRGGFILTDEMDEAAFLTYPIFTVDGDFMKNMYEIPIDKELMHLLQVDFSDKEILSNPVNLSYGQQQKPVSYTHLTLPTKRIVENSVVAVT